MLLMMTMIWSNILYNDGATWMHMKDVLVQDSTRIYN